MLIDWRMKQELIPFHLMVEEQLGFLQTGKNMFSCGCLAWYWFVENYSEAQSVSNKRTAAGNS